MQMETAVLGLQERDEAVERVLAVEVLHLLAAEGAHGQVVADRLAASEVWQAYQGQRHDLFLPGGATPQVRVVVCDGCVMMGRFLEALTVNGVLLAVSGQDVMQAGFLTCYCQVLRHLAWGG